VAGLQLTSNKPTVAFTGATSTAQQDVIDAVSKLPAGKIFADALPVDARLSLSEALPRLEAANPTPTPSTSSLLEGAWQFVMVSGPPPGIVASPTRELALLFYSGGYGPGIAGLAISERLPETLLSVNGLTLNVRSSQPRAEVVANVKLGGTTEATVRVESTLAVESGSRLLEIWSSVEVSGPVNQKLALPEQLQYKRRIFVTYLDDVWAVIRDEGGGASILKRVNKSMTEQLPAMERMMTEDPVVNGVDVEVMDAR